MGGFFMIQKLKDYTIRVKQKKYQRPVFITALITLAFLVGSNPGFAKKESTHQTQTVLGIETKATTPTPTVSPTLTPAPTAAPALKKVTPTITPRPTLTSVPIPTPTPTPSQSSTSTVTPTSTATLTPTLTSVPTQTPTPTITPTPTQISQSIEIAIDYGGKHANDTYTVAITPGETAWDAVKAALGLANLQYTDYGGDLGIFISGFNGVTAAANEYFDFRVNGVSSSVGISTYTCNNSDKLSFVLTSF